MRSLSVLAVLVLTSGCVGKARYEALKTDYDALLQEQQVLADELKTCNADRAKQPDPTPLKDNGEARGPTGNR